MYQEFFISKGVLMLPIVAMLSFVLSFLVIVLRSLDSNKTAHHEGLAEMPLDGESQLAAADKKEVLP